MDIKKKEIDMVNTQIWVDIYIFISHEGSPQHPSTYRPPPLHQTVLLVGNVWTFGFHFHWEHLHRKYRSIIIEGLRAELGRQGSSWRSKIPFHISLTLEVIRAKQRQQYDHKAKELYQRQSTRRSHLAGASSSLSSLWRTLS